MGTYDPMPADAATGWGAWLRAAISGLDGRITAVEAPVVNTRTSASYTLAIADAGRVVENTSATANAVIVPPNLSVAIPVGAAIYLRQMGLGVMSVQPGSGVTIRSRGGALQLGGQYAEAVLTKRAVDEWLLSGDIT